MVSIDRFQNGLSNYIDREILIKLPQWKAVAFGTAAALCIRKIPDIVKSIPDPIGIVKDGCIDIDAVAEELKKRMDNPVQIDIPVIGTMTIDSTEVDRLIDYMKR